MRVQVKVPKMGLTVEEVTFSAWERAAGDTVKAGDIIALVEADKASVEIVAPADGQLTELRAQEGDLLEVGSTLAIIDT